MHAVCFSEIPPHLGLPSIHTGYWTRSSPRAPRPSTVVCMHIGSSSKMPATSADAPAAVQATLSFSNAMASMSDFLFSGVLVDFPDLKLAYSEGQIGWIPYILERADDVWEEHRAWGGVRDRIPEPPSTYYYDHIYGCFFRDRHGLKSLDEVGVDNVTFETDYPHTDSTWPHTKEVAEKMFAGPRRRHRSTRSSAATRSGCCRFDLDLIARAGSNVSAASLRGRLLVATPVLLDPNFVRTVVLMLEHNEDGAVGVVLNRPTELTAAEALPAWEPVCAAPAVVFVGGPVQPDGRDRSRRDSTVDPSAPTDGVTVLWPGLGTVDLDADPGAIEPDPGPGPLLRRVLGLGRRPARGRARHGVVVRGRRRSGRRVDLTAGRLWSRGAAPPTWANRPVRPLSARPGGELSRREQEWLGNHPRREDVQVWSCRGGAPVSESTTVAETEAPATETPPTEAPPSGAAWAGPADAPATTTAEAAPPAPPEEPPAPVPAAPAAKPPRRAVAVPVWLLGFLGVGVLVVGAFFVGRQTAPETSGPKTLCRRGRADRQGRHAGRRLQPPGPHRRAPAERQPELQPRRHPQPARRQPLSPTWVSQPSRDG